MSNRQPELFAPPADVREERRFGKMDALCGLPLSNHYSSRITGERLSAYTEAFRQQRSAMTGGRNE